MQRFAVEYDRRSVGVAVRVPGGFIFYASDDRFDHLDGRLFRRARAIERHLKKAAAKPQPQPGRIRRAQEKPSFA